MDRRLIEETFPIKEIGDECDSERGDEHISRFHVWWARRPLAVSRATAFAALVQSKSNNQQLKEFVIKISKSENALDKNYLDEAYKKIKNKNITIIDPFSGGGSIPLEAMRIGCKAIAMDINPVAHFLLKCTLEFPFKFQKSKKSSQFEPTNNLVSEIKKWGKWVFEESEKILGKYYPDEENGNKIFTYIWARVIKCQNPSCKKEIPLLTNFTLKKNAIFLYPEIKQNSVKFRIIDLSKEHMPKGFDPTKGTISQAIATCLHCGFQNGTRKKDERESHISNLFVKKEFNEQIIAVVTINKNRKKSYRTSNENDFRVFEKVLEETENFRRKFKKDFDINPLPDEIVLTPSGKEYEPGGTYYNFIFSTTYGFTKWIDQFNSRQKFSLMILMYYIRSAWNEMIKQKYDSEDAKIIISYLAVIFDKLLVRNSSFGVWHNGAEGPEKLFAFAGLPMKWSYPEANPILQSKNAFTFLGCIDAVSKVVDHLTKIPIKNNPVVKFGSIFDQDFQDKSIDAIFTDPPYYDMIHYSVLSDFFYVWLKKIVGFQFQETFSTPLTPKSQECISELELIRGMDKTLFKKEYPNVKDSISYKNNITKIFKEMYRVLKDDGIATIVFAHKSFKTWEIILNSILESQFVVTATWPIETEMKSRQKAKDDATVTSTIYIVCRKVKKESFCSYSLIKKQLGQHINNKIEFLQKENITGIDFLIALIGSSIEVFGKYEKITDNADNEIKVPQLLKDVRSIVSESAIKSILNAEISSEISNLTRFYIFYRFSFKDKSVDFDDARLLATSLGVDLDYESNRGFIKKTGKIVSCISPVKRNIDEIKEPTELIDVLHKVLILWRNNKKEEYEKLLTESGYANNDTFKRVARAISESLPDDIQEKKWIDQFLTGFTESGGIDDKQTKLF